MVTLSSDFDSRLRELSLRGRPRRRAEGSTGLPERKAATSALREKVTSSVLSSLNFTSHRLAQACKASRSVFKEAAAALRCAGEAIILERVESSAKTLRSLVTQLKMSSMKHKNRIGPRTLPCGTPARTGSRSEYELPTRTRCWRFTKNR